jgi:hypothetical protein
VLSAGIASALDGSKGRIREAVEAVLDGNGGGALHVAAAHGRTRVCAYLVEELQMDVNAIAVLSGATLLSNLFFHREERLAHHIHKLHLKKI